MHTISLSTNAGTEISVKIPASWNELSSSQLLDMARIILDGTELESIKIKLLFLFTDIKVMERDSEILGDTEYFWLHAKDSKPFLVSAFDLAYISKPFLKFFTPVADDRFALNPLLTKNLLPKIKVGGKWLYGPADGLSNLIFNEFINTETFYSEYIGGNEASLNKLVAILYRPGNKLKPGNKKYNGDSRIAFNDNNIDINAKFVSRMPAEYKKAVLWYYEGCKQHICTLFPYMFKKENGSYSRSQENVFRVFMTIVDDLADQRPADKDRIRNTSLYDVLDSMNRKIELSIRSSSSSTDAL